MAAASMVLGACSNSRPHPWGEGLDRVGQALDDYGTASVSSPLLVDVRKLPADFAFKLQAGADDYYRDARQDVQGVGGVFSQRASDFRGGLRVQANLQDLVTNELRLGQFNRESRQFRRREALQDAGAFLKVIVPFIDPKLALAVAAAEANADADTVEDPEAPGSVTPQQETTNRLGALIAALGDASVGLSGPTSAPAIPEFSHDPPEVDETVLADNDLVEQLIQDQKFGRFRAMLEGMPTSQPVVANRGAIITAGGDSMVESILTYLGRPVVPGDWKDKCVLMGVSMVSVAPGTRTMRGYMADVAVTCKVQWRTARYDVTKELIADGDEYGSDLIAAASRVDAKGPWEDWLRARAAMRAEQVAQREAESAELAASAADAAAVSLSADLGAIHGVTTPPDFLGSSNESVRSAWESESADSKRRKLEQLVRFGDDKRKEAEQARTRAREEGLRATALIGREETTEPAYVEDLKLYELQGGTLVEPGGSMIDPVVSAASPMTDAQTLDLASSIRQQQAFAFKLALVVSGFGAEAQAQGLFKFIDRLEQDFQTRSPMNTVAAYSNAGSTFGYQIGPSLLGIADFVPSQRVGGLGNFFDGLVRGDFRPGPDMILQRQSFPVALFIGLNRRDLRVRLAQNKNGNWLLVEPTLRFEQTVRWIPIPASKADNSCEARPRIRESDRVSWAWDLARAKTLADPACESDIPWNDLNKEARREFRQYVNSRADTLRSQALLATSFQTLPAELIVRPTYADPPAIPEVVSLFQADQQFAAGGSERRNAVLKTQATIVGEHLERVSRVEAVPSDVKVFHPEVSPRGNALIVTVEIDRPDAAEDVVFQLKLEYELELKKQFTLTPAFRVKPAAKKEAAQAGTPASAKSLDLTRTKERSFFGLLTRDCLSMPIGVPVEVIRAFIDPSSAVPRGKLSVSVDTELESHQSSVIEPVDPK